MSSRHAVRKVPGKRKWIVKGLNTGRVLGRHSSKKSADRQLRAVEWSMHKGEHSARGRRRARSTRRHQIFKL